MIIACSFGQHSVYSKKKKKKTRMPVDDVIHVVPIKSHQFICQPYSLQSSLIFSFHCVTEKKLCPPVAVSQETTENTETKSYWQEFC